MSQMNSPMTDPLESPQLDNDMAELTDALLAGRPASATNDPTLAAIVKELVDLSTESAPSDKFRSRLTQRLNAEWESVHQLRGVRQRRIAAPLWSLLAAAAIAIVGLAAILSQTPVTTGGGVQGTAVGDASILPVLGIGAVLVLAIGIGLLWFRRSK